MKIWESCQKSESSNICSEEHSNKMKWNYCDIFIVSVCTHWPQKLHSYEEKYGTVKMEFPLQVYNLVKREALFCFCVLRDEQIWRFMNIEKGIWWNVHITLDGGESKWNHSMKEEQTFTIWSAMDGRQIAYHLTKCNSSVIY